MPWAEGSPSEWPTTPASAPGSLFVALVTSALEGNESLFLAASCPAGRAVDQLQQGTDLLAWLYGRQVVRIFYNESILRLRGDFLFLMKTKASDGRTMSARPMHAIGLLGVRVLA